MQRKIVKKIIKLPNWNKENANKHLNCNEINKIKIMHSAIRIIQNV